MLRKNYIQTAALGICVILGLLIFAGAGYGEVWDRYPAEREGGVIFDFAYNSATEVLYAAAGENALWHQTYNNGWPWTWTEHLPGRGCFGVDAYRLTTGAGTFDYVLVATQWVIARTQTKQKIVLRGLTLA